MSIFAVFVYFSRSFQPKNTKLRGNCTNIKSLILYTNSIGSMDFHPIEVKFGKGQISSMVSRIPIQEFLLLHFLPFYGTKKLKKRKCYFYLNECDFINLRSLSDQFLSLGCPKLFEKNVCQKSTAPRGGGLKIYSKGVKGFVGGFSKESGVCDLPRTLCA